MLTNFEYMNMTTNMCAHTYRFLSRYEEVEHGTSQLPTTYQHHSPTRILHIHGHTMPTHMSPTRTCTLTMEQGFS